MDDSQGEKQLSARDMLQFMVILHIWENLID